MLATMRHGAVYQTAIEVQVRSKAHPTMASDIVETLAIPR
jgi:hypothetical protein